jgi:hypothetical protein
MLPIVYLLINKIDPVVLMTDYKQWMAILYMIQYTRH